MTKEELVTKLKELGFQAELIDNIPFIFNVNRYSEADKAVKELGYVGTYGVKLRVGVADDSIHGNIKG